MNFLWFMKLAVYCTLRHRKIMVDKLIIVITITVLTWCSLYVWNPITGRLACINSTAYRVIDKSSETDPFPVAKKYYLLRWST